MAQTKTNKNHFGDKISGKYSKLVESHLLLAMRLKCVLCAKYYLCIQDDQLGKKVVFETQCGLVSENEYWI